MLFISHRGNISGTQIEFENEPSYIERAVSLGFDCEVDFWVIKNRKYSGHDEPQYLLDDSFLEKYLGVIWFHCKNLEALNFISEQSPRFIGFWHETDSYTLTSNGFIWTYPEKKTTRSCILVNLQAPSSNFDFAGLGGICSDFVMEFKLQYESLK